MEQKIRELAEKGISFEVHRDIVKIFQNTIKSSKIYNQKELIGIAREVFPDAKIQPNIFSLDISQINLVWIENKMEEFGIRKKDLIRQLALDEDYISKMFSDRNKENFVIKKEFKALFYYYFLSFELGNKIYFKYQPNPKPSPHFYNQRTADSDSNND